MSTFHIMNGTCIWCENFVIERWRRQAWRDLLATSKRGHKQHGIMSIKWTNALKTPVRACDLTSAPSSCYAWRVEDQPGPTCRLIMRCNNQRFGELVRISPNLYNQRTTFWNVLPGSKPRMTMKLFSSIHEIANQTIQGNWQPYHD